MCWTRDFLQGGNKLRSTFLLMSIFPSRPPLFSLRIVYLKWSTLVSFFLPYIAHVNASSSFSRVLETSQWSPRAPRIFWYFSVFSSSFICRTLPLPLKALVELQCVEAWSPRSAVHICCPSSLVSSDTQDYSILYACSGSRICHSQNTITSHRRFLHCIALYIDVGH